MLLAWSLFFLPFSLSLGANQEKSLHSTALSTPRFSKLKKDVRTVILYSLILPYRHSIYEVSLSLVQLPLNELYSAVPLPSSQPMVMLPNSLHRVHQAIIEVSLFSGVLPHSCQVSIAKFDDHATLRQSFPKFFAASRTFYFHY